MKKLNIILAVTLLFAGQAFGEGYFLNKMGACSDPDGTESLYDLIDIINNEKSAMHFSDYAEFGYSWEKAEITAYLHFNSSEGKDDADTGNPEVGYGGYGIIKPLPFLSIAAGNDTRDRFTFSGGEVYTLNEAYFLQANPLQKGVGLVLNHQFGNFDLTAIANLDTEKDYYINAGLDVTYKNDLLNTSLQLVGQNITNKNDYYHYSIFACLSLPGMDFSAGYINNYNNTEINTFDPKVDWYQAFLPAVSTHVLKFSGRYKNDYFIIAADYITGLNKEYVVTTDYKKRRAAYDVLKEAGMIIPPERIYDWKIGIHDEIPRDFVIKGGWFATKNTAIYLVYDYESFITKIHSFYPYCDWQFSEKSNLRFGAKISFTDDTFSISIPLMWKVLLDIK